MKRILHMSLLAGLLVLTMIATAQGGMIPEELADALPEEAEQLLDEWETRSGDGGAVLRGLSGLGREIREKALAIVKEYAAGAILILTAALLCGAAGAMQDAAGGPAERYIPLAGALAITAAAAGSIRSMAEMGMETLEQMQVFSRALLPSLTAAEAAAGCVVSAGLRQVVTVLFTDALIDLSGRVLLPLVYCHAAVSIADAALPEHELKRLREGIEKVVTGTLKLLPAIFTLFLTIAGAAGTAADAAALRMTRTAISTAIPVVGSILSDAAGSVLAGAGMLRGALGVFGLLGILAVCLTPFLRLAIQYGLYKLTALLASAGGPGPLADLIDALGTSMGMLLGMAGACAVMLLISVAAAVSMVVT